ncbi:MAG: hypothetical protein OXC62_05250 [Aestuariivita sp.]|nr:hypothetical protein [Aestuariivita sp.]
MIKDHTSKIKDDISEEFDKIRSYVSCYFNKKSPQKIKLSDIDVELQREISRRRKVLFETLINYLMTDARASIENESASLQNEFYELDLRNKFHYQTSIDNLSELKNLWTRDPRLWAGTIAASVVGAVGMVTTAKIDGSQYMFLKVAILLGTVVATLISYKGAKNLPRDLARRFFDEYIAKYTQKVENEVTVYLERIESDFEATFDEFLLSSRNAQKGT